MKIVGHLLVQFQMKNIISWTKPTLALAKRLTKTVRHVITPILAKRAKEAAASKEERAFEMQSVSQKLSTVESAGEKLIRALKLKAYYSPRATGTPKEKLCNYKVINGVLHALVIHPVEKLSAEKLALISRTRGWHSMESIQGVKHRKVLWHLLVPTLSRAPHATINSRLRYWSPVEERVFGYSPEESRYGARVLYVSDAIRSQSHLISWLKPRLKLIAAGNQPVAPSGVEISEAQVTGAKRTHRARPLFR
jgi:hypothetical protein